MGNYIRQTIQGEQEPVCTHCRGTDLKKDGRRNGRQKYECRTCGRISYGLPPDLRPRCPWCRGAVRETRLSDGRLQYLCPACKKKFLSEYEQARHERGTVRRYRHIVNFYLNTRARLALVEYAQATRLTEPQALAAVTLTM